MKRRSLILGSASALIAAALGNKYTPSVYAASMDQYAPITMLPYTFGEGRTFTNVLREPDVLTMWKGKVPWAQEHLQDLEEHKHNVEWKYSTRINGTVQFIDLCSYSTCPVGIMTEDGIQFMYIAAAHGVRSLEEEIRLTDLGYTRTMRTFYNVPTLDELLDVLDEHLEIEERFGYSE